VSALSQLTDGLVDDRRASTYEALAQSAMRAFGVTGREVTFLGHNSGAAFRLERAHHDRLLLKVHAPRGDGDPLSPDAVRGGLQWLASMAELTDIPVQTPLPDPRGALLATVYFRGLSLHCSLQHWLEGRHVEELSTSQAFDVGQLMGRWHAFSQQHRAATSAGGVHYDGHYLEHALAGLEVLRVDGALPAQTWHTIEDATTVASGLMERLGTSGDVYGVVHGDLNPDNIVVADDGTVRFLDLAQLALAPYLWDIGTALYQYAYQEPSVRRAMLAGYHSARPELTIPPLALEAFVCAAALSNLAFQCSIPAQRTSTLFHANVQRFATEYCRDLLIQVPFALD
jgi:Ser/Thr protein kinase RdoA (MazF antagonist)